jgi:Pyruvate/2-oxoacid:ferredoxin oxidoreductase delta subunit
MDSITFIQPKYLGRFDLWWRERWAVIKQNKATDCNNSFCFSPEGCRRIYWTVIHASAHIDYLCGGILIRDGVRFRDSRYLQ